MGYGNRFEVARACALQERHRDVKGRYLLMKAPAMPHLHAVAKGKPNKWAT